MRVEEINKDIVGMVFNGILVTQVTDGTLDTVPVPVYRYKIPVEDGYLRDKEEKIIIKESRSQMFGTKVGAKQYGTELIEVVCGDPDDKRVWWVEDPKYRKKVIARDPGTKKHVSVDVLIKPKHGMGTYEEFVDLVNSRGEKKDEEIAEDDIPIAAPDDEDFDHTDIEFIKANYMTMGDADIAEELDTDEDSVRQFRVKTLGLKKNAKKGAKKKRKK